MEKILVSACLLGARIRYDGAAMACDHADLRLWTASGRVVPVCPEVAAGLAVPRRPAEIVGSGGGPGVIRGTARVLCADGTDLTGPYLRGARMALEAARREGIRLAILKERSPACGSSLIYDGTFGRRTVEGMGVAAALLRLDGVDIYSEQHIRRAAQRLRALDPGAGP